MAKITRTIGRNVGDGYTGCLCSDGTYSINCCKGWMINQGIGSTMYSGDYVEQDYWDIDYSE